MGHEIKVRTVNLPDTDGVCEVCNGESGWPAEYAVQAVRGFKGTAPTVRCCAMTRCCEGAKRMVYKRLREGAA